MNTRPTRSPGTRLSLEVLEAREVPAITIAIDYSLDLRANGGSGFFEDHADAKTVLRQVANEMGQRITADLSAIAPTGANAWTAAFFNPENGQQYTITNLNVAANTIIVYVGGRAMSIGEAGQGGSGGYGYSGSAAWGSAVASRGWTGFAPWGGSIAFDTTQTWDFDLTTIGLNSTTTDFYSVATHELGHLLGIGTAPQWFSKVQNGTFVGTNSEAAYGGPVPVYGDSAHWADGLKSNGQFCVMDPILHTGERRTWTSLDEAALRDVGWANGLVVSPPVTPPTVPPPPVSPLVVPPTAGGTPSSLSAVGNFGGSVSVINATTGAVLTTIRPLDAGTTQYTGLVEVALGDFNGDGVTDLAVSAADPLGVDGLDASKAGKVFVYDGTTLTTGTLPLIETFTPFATHDGPDGTTGDYTNGLNIAVGDVNGDGHVDLIAGTRGGNGTATGGRNEFGRLVVIDGTSPNSTNTVIGGVQTPFGSGYQKGVVVAAGNVMGTGGAEIAVTRGGPVASNDPTVQQIKVKVLQLQGSTLTELHLSADGSTAFAPFASLGGPASAINRDGRVAFVDANGDGKAELVFTALDPLTNPGNKQVRVGAYSITVGAATGAATIVSTGPDAGTYLTGSAVVDQAITHVVATGSQQNLALLTEGASSGIVYLSPLTGVVQTGGGGLSVLHGGISIDGI